MLNLENRAVRIGIIGYRGFSDYCTQALHDAKIAEVNAYAGRDSVAMAAAALRHGVPRYYTDWRDLVQDDTIDLVHIATPPDSHAQIAIGSLKAGKHVLIEKPLALSNSDAEDILAAAHTAKRIAGIHYIMRYNSIYVKIQQIAASKVLGELTHISFENYASDERLDDLHWFWDQSKSGGIFVEHGVHFFDIVGHIVGSPVRSVLGLTWVRRDGAKEDRVQATVEYENGTEATFYHAFNNPGVLESQRMRFAFERGQIDALGWTPNVLTLRAAVTEEGYEYLLKLLSEIKIEQSLHSMIQGRGHEYWVDHIVRAEEIIGTADQVYRLSVCDAFSDLSLAVFNLSHQLKVSAEDGAISLKIALAARESAEKGAKVSL